MKILASLAIILGLASHATSLAAPQTRDLEWKPNQTLRRGLIPVPAREASEFQLLRPQDYQFQTMPGPAGSQAKAWVSPPRADKTRVYLMVTTLTPPKEEATSYTADQVLDKMLSSIERRRKDWKRSATQRGTVNGLTFYRAYWKGTDTQTGQQMRGFSYVTQIGNSFFQLSSQDIEPAATTSLALMETMTLTFTLPAPSR